MKNWAWLLPCWVWKYFFAQFPRERVRLDGRTRFLVRLDEEFALVYDPAGPPEPDEAGLDQQVNASYVYETQSPIDCT
jgi:hypothetical protein